MATPVGPLFAAGTTEITKSGYKISFLPEHPSRIELSAPDSRRFIIGCRTRCAWPRRTTATIASA